jgi:hypothetical protein
VVEFPCGHFPHEEKTVAEKTEAKAAEVLSQIDMRGIGCNGAVAVQEKAKSFMARIGGTIEDVKRKVSRDERAFFVCIGQFFAINAAGDHFCSDKMIFPGGTGEGLEGQAKIANKRGQAVDFAVDIYSVPDAAGKPTPTGYTFTAVPLIESRATNRAASIMEGIGKPLPNAKATAKK